MSETGGKMSEVIEVVCDFNEDKGFCPENCMFYQNTGCTLLNSRNIKQDMHKGDRIKIEIIREGK